jgi:hypothetical protein
MAQVPKQRARNFFYLGLGIARILENASAGAQTVRQYNQLMEEFEYFVSGSGTQSVKGLMAKSIHQPYPSLEQTTNNSSAGLKKFAGELVFEILQTPKIVFPLDYCSVVVSLCGMLSQLYQTFTHEDNYSEVINSP